MADETRDLVRIVTDKGLDVAFSFLDDRIRKLGDHACQVGRQHRKNGSSEFEARQAKDSLRDKGQSEIRTMVPRGAPRERLNRHAEDVTEKRTWQDRCKARVQDLRQKEIEAEEALTRAKSHPQRTPSVFGIVAVGAVLAALFGAVLAPTIPLVAPEVRQLGRGIHLLIGFGLGVGIVFPSFYAAYYPVSEFIVRHGSLIVGFMITSGIAALRYAQIGEWNSAILGLIVIEYGLVISVEVIGAILRARYADRLSTDQFEATLRTVRRELETDRDDLRRAEERMELAKKEFADEEARVRLIQTLADSRDDYLLRVTDHLGQRFDEGYRTAQE